MAIPDISEFNEILSAMRFYPRSRHPKMPAAESHFFPPLMNPDTYENENCGCIRRPDDAALREAFLIA
jgi:hypothetical protein